MTLAATVSTTLIAVAVIVTATVGLGLHQLDAGDWLAVVGGFAGGTGVLHTAGQVLSSSSSSKTGG